MGVGNLSFGLVTMVKGQFSGKLDVIPRPDRGGDGPHHGYKDGSTFPTRHGYMTIIG